MRLIKAYSGVGLVVAQCALHSMIRVQITEDFLHNKSENCFDVINSLKTEWKNQKDAGADQ